MSQKIRLPSIQGENQQGQLEQIRSYLYQLASQLNWLLEDLAQNTQIVRSGAWSLDDAHLAFSQLRPLIMNSGEILDSYRQQLKTTFATIERVDAMVQGKTYVWQEDGELTVQSRFTSYSSDSSYQSFLAFGSLGGAAVLECWTLIGNGSLLQTGSTPVMVTEDGRFTVPGNAGDTLTILSQDTFSIL